MGRAEYIVHFKGDYSALQKDLAKISAATTKLENDEVIIKLNYDGNIAEFNKQFDKIAKMHPELGIQFQYNVNEKMLNQEINKLKKLTELKLDIDEGNVQNKLKNLASNVEASLQEGLSKDEITKRLKEFFGYYNTSIKAGAKNIDFDFDSLSNKLFDAFKNQKDEIKEIYNDIWNQNDTKEIKLFEIDQSIDNDISKTQERVTDLKDALDSLEKKGASKSGLPSELQKVQDEIKILRADISEMQEQLKDLSGEAFNNMTQQIKNTNEQLDIAKDRLKTIQDFLKNNGNSEMLNFTEALNKLQGMLSVFYKENNGNHISSFWDELIQKAQDGDKEVLQLLSDLRLLKDDNLPNKVNAGMVKSGGLIGDDYTVLTTKIRSNKFSGDRLKDAEELKNRLDAISNSGVNAARTLAIVSDEANNLFVEIQQTAPGKMLGQIYGQTDKDWVNMDFLKAEDEEILKLIVDLETLRKAGIGVELNAGNLLYQKGKGFSIIDMDLKPLQDYEETISESQDILLDSIRQFFEEQTDETGNIKAEAQEAINALDSFSDRFGAIAKEKRELIDKLSTEGANNNQILINDAATEATKEAADAIKKAQDSNSPAELTKPLGQNFTEGYAEGIREAIPEVVQACKEVVLAAYNAIKETKTSEDGESIDFSEGFINTFKESLDKAVPTIQEKIKEVFSKINIGDENSSMFEGIGQEIIDSIIVGLKNAHSGESFTASLENIINNAFTQVALDSAVRDFLVQLQTTMDTQGNLRLKYFSVDTDSIVFQIQNGLDNNTFNINLGGTIQGLASTLNTSAENVRMSFIDAIKWIREANEFQRMNNEETRERTLFYNSKTGEFSNPAVIGDTHSVNGATSNTVKYNELMKGKKFDTDLHWHQDWSTAAPSPQDLAYDFINAYADGIEKFVVGAQNELTEIDFSKIAKDGQELAEKARSYLSNNIKSVEEALDEFIDRNGEKEGITYYDSANVDSTILQSDSDVRRLYGQYLKAILDNEWNKLKNDFIEKAQKAKYDDYVGNASFFDFTLLQSEKDKIGDAIGNLGLTDIFGDSRYTTALSKEISSNLDFSSFGSDFFTSLMNNVKKGIDYTSFDGSMQSIREVVEETFEDNIDLDYQDILGNKFEKFKEFTIQYASEFIDNLFTDIQTKLTKEESNEAYQQAGKQALKNISEKTLLKESVNTYTHDEFEQKYGKGITSQFSTNSIQGNIGDNFQAQLQNAIDESGKYIVKVYGELVEDFKSRLQNAIDETGLYHVDVEGWLYDTFHDGLQQDIDGQEKYIIEVKGRLFDTFKEVLQEAIDGLGAFPIEVKPYIRKSSEIEEVDLPGGDQANLSSSETNAEIQSLHDGLIKLRDLKIELSKIDTNSEDGIDDAYNIMYQIQTIEDKLSELYSFNKKHHIIDASSTINDINEIEDRINQFVNGKIIKMYRGVDNPNNPIESLGEHGGGTFFTDDLQSAKYYGQNGKLYEAELMIKDALEFIPDINSMVDAVTFTGNGKDDVSRQLKSAIEFVEESGYSLSQFRNILMERYDEFRDGSDFSIPFDTLDDGLKDALQTIVRISEDTNNIYGVYRTTDTFAEKAQTNGYDSLIIHDIAEAFNEAGEEIKSTIAVIFEAKQILSSLDITPNETPISTSSTEAETKALLSKKEVVEQLRAELNLTKKAAEDIFNEQGYSKTNGKYQIEQQAIDELITSLKEKQQLEGNSTSTTPTTSSVADNIQSEVDAVTKAIDAEKKKFDELKNKISKTIPNAIETKNKAFEKEGNLVAKIVDDEITYFEVLKDSVDNVTDSIGKQQNSVKDLKPKSKSNNSKKLEDTTNEIDKEALLRQHNTELFRNYAQSIGQKSQIQQDMSAYYAQLEKDSAKAYSDAEKKANSLLGKVKKLQNSNKYTQDFVEKLNSAENELTNFLKELSKGTISFDEVDSRVKILSENIENTLSKKAFGSVKQAAEKSLTNVGLKIDQIIAKNSAMGKDFESRFKALRRSLESETTIEGVQKIIAEVNKLESELIATGNTGKSFIDQIKQRLRDINSKYIAQYFSFQDIIRYARQAATNVIQLNDAFIELSKVSNTSLETLERDFQSYADIAHDIGGTISDTINATADWARMGMINAPLYGDI